MNKTNRKTIPLALAFVMLALNSSVLQTARAASWFTNTLMNTPRDSHTATVLPNGKLLMVGGRNNGVSPVLTNAELYDLVTEFFTNTASLTVARS